MLAPERYTQHRNTIAPVAIEKQEAPLTLGWTAAGRQPCSTGKVRPALASNTSQAVSQRSPLDAHNLSSYSGCCLARHHCHYTNCSRLVTPQFFSEQGRPHANSTARPQHREHLFYAHSCSSVLDRASRTWLYCHQVVGYIGSPGSSLQETRGVF